MNGRIWRDCDCLNDKKLWLTDWEMIETNRMNRESWIQNRLCLCFYSWFVSRNWQLVCSISFTYVMKRLGSKRCPDDVRIAMAWCLFMMGRIDDADGVFNRCPRHMGGIYGRLCIALKHYLTSSHRNVFDTIPLNLDTIANYENGSILEKLDHFWWRLLGIDFETVWCINDKLYCLWFDA